MWIRLGFDIRWRDLFRAALWSALPMKQISALGSAEALWRASASQPGKETLVALSVRTAFDLALRALDLPDGSEVLLSAMTVPHMSAIVESHGLVAVPLDTDATGRVHPDVVRSAITASTRMIVIAHLFGRSNPMGEICSLAEQRGILVVEDCAQCFFHVGDSGHPDSDIVLHSFGPIKSCTALGGAVASIREACLASRMRAIAGRDPMQGRLAFAGRLLRCTILKGLTTTPVDGVLLRLMAWLGADPDHWFSGASRSFRRDALLPQIRRRPSAPLLRLLERRWRSHSKHAGSMRWRQEIGRHLDQQLMGGMEPSTDDANERDANERDAKESDGAAQRPSTHSSYWVYPIFVDNRQLVVRHLREAGFDATWSCSMSIVAPTADGREASNAKAAWSRILFLPWCPHLDQEAADRMAKMVLRVAVGLALAHTDENTSRHQYDTLSLPQAR